MKTVDDLSPEEFTLPPLHQAARQRDAGKAREFIAGGADVNAADARAENGDGGNTPLWYAAQGMPGGGVAVADLLVRAGADVGAAGEFGMTALHMACSWGHADIVAFLHRAGASVVVKDEYGRMPMELARAVYEEGKAMARENWPDGFEAWLEGMAGVCKYFEDMGN